MNRRMLLVALLLVGVSSLAVAQPQAKDETKAKAGAKGRAGRKAAKRKQMPRPTPTVADYEYGTDSKRQVFDFWQAKSAGSGDPRTTGGDSRPAGADKPTPLVLLIHGGGWRGGDKTNYRKNQIQPFLDAGISVAAINYRYVTEAYEKGVKPPVKASLHDAARALQTLRSKTKEWNIDPTRVGATGSSAGACTSLWLALHDDLADPKSDDPIARESTRLTCAAVVGAQTSLDPIQVREWIPNAIYGGHAFGFGMEGQQRPEQFALLMENRESVLPLIKEYSPIESVSEDDPAIYLSYPNQKKPPKQGQEEADPTHSAMYGVGLEEALKAAGVEVVLAYPGHEDTKYGSTTEFLIEKLKGE